MKQFLITPAAGKRLIAKALKDNSTINGALKSGTVVIIAGTTNGYVAEEILSSIDQQKDFSRESSSGESFYLLWDLPVNLGD